MANSFHRVLGNRRDVSPVRRENNIIIISSLKKVA